ncbi:lysophospholipid acyltransferase family protein [Jatrophihabitans sp.]|uniref:lysophospholipid acyltransferase family protein n=1 Tax=Jatrophihabitans sp. TaxID=1932789 RepID=UPI0030C78268|nr:phospholipid/glycerol acyltransferase [Jatrophihabitans sp.]
MSRLHKPKAGFWIRTWVSILYPLDGLLFKIRWRHIERVVSPEQGGVIIAINHTSQIDTVLMARFVWQSGRVPRFMIKAGVFGWPIVGFMMKGAGQIPVYRGTADASQSLRDAVSALARGEAIVIYPEGTTTKDPTNWPMQAKTGIARLVLLSPNTPVVPIGQWGAHKRHGEKVERGFLGRRLFQASVGEPMDLSSYAGVEPTAAVLREVTDKIMTQVTAQVAELRGQTPPEEFFKPARVYVDKT